MPTYDFRCDSCGQDREVFLKLSEHGEVIPQCCEQDMRQVILTAPHGHVQMDCRYVSPITGESVTSWKGRSEEMARHDLVDATDHNKAAMKRAKARKAECEQAARELAKSVPLTAAQQRSIIKESAEARRA